MSTTESAARELEHGRAAPEQSRLPSHSTQLPSESDVWHVLAGIPDPEIPAVSVVDLGVIGAVEVAPGRIRVELLPTFVGCPAIELMRGEIAERLGALAGYVEVELSFAEPWTTARITPEGRRKLRDSGLAPPAAASVNLVPLAPAAPCPYCDSRRTVLENAFGPTLCRAIYYCTDCRQPFEQFKAV
ncbi:MAG: phenylacetate-CoA oxygenase subunit PaaJ [Chloroflexota bacterium]|nr:phenylacetate-CoA oxygenase subunit PaaJ [Chloroflexota bacterium]